MLYTNNVSKSKSSWSPSTFQRFPQWIFTNHKVPKIFSSKSPPSENKLGFFHQKNRCNQVVQCEISFSSVYHFRFRKENTSIKFQLQQFPRTTGFRSPKRIVGWYVLQSPNHQNRSDAFTEFFSSNPRLIEVGIDSYRASPCDLGFLAILRLHYGWIEVGGWVGEWKWQKMAKGWSRKQTERCRMVVRNYTDPRRNLSRGKNPEAMMVSKAGFGSSSFFQSSIFRSMFLVWKC